MSKLVEGIKDRMVAAAREAVPAVADAAQKAATAAAEKGRTETNRPTASDARERLEQRIAGFFAEPATGSLSQFA